ncbi:zinc finger MYM-type protein 1-like [Simochromis diagramma]|uniref:zinc finger MYM-type protein 1-like n=1 Tax=Simochromis diagramma TaxID=43689 RepID=UPI001A7EF345|nr:zinc finger MYM-type protein 1-like [Simochromis diagramma]
MDREAEEDQVITERGEQTGQERENDEAAAATHSTTGFDLGDKDTGPRQVKLKSYPHDTFGTQKQAFNHSWFEKHNWLEYSVNQNAAFCFPCRVFGKNIKHDSLVSSGCKNWKKALVIFGKHEMAQTHKDSVVTWKSYQGTSKQGNVAQMIATANVSEIVERREYLRRIVAVTSMLGRQGLPFRGHDEGEDSPNRGNFLVCMELLKEFDPFLQKHNPPSNAQYISPTSQNDMIDCCAQEVTSVIVSEMTKSKVYSIMVDEARDKKAEQLAVCVRYVSEGAVKERFLALAEIKPFDAQSIANEIQQQIQNYGLAELKCVAQTYDGAAVMSGSTGGVQAHFRRLHPEAIYVHCYAHQLNLVLCNTCKAVPEAVGLFSLLECVYSFFSTSLVNHHKFMETQAKLGLTKTELVQLSNTRWACQLRSISAVLETLPAILECLSAIGSPIAVGLRAKLYKFSAVYALLMFQLILSETKGLHKFLQKETLDLAEAFICKQAVCDTIKGKHSDAFATELYEKTKALCNTHSIPEPGAKTRHKQRKMEDFVLEATVGSRTELNNSDTLKRELLFPCVDRMVGELDQRFCSVDAGLLKGVQACSPESENFLSEPHLNELAKHYRLDLKKEEVLVARNFLTRKTEAGCPPKNMLSVYNLLDSDMFPSLKATIQVALTVPVSSCSCERSFSALRRLHSWLRQTMGQKRLHSLAVMSTEKDTLQHLSHNRVIDRFATLKNRRHSLMLPPTK